MTVGDQPVRVLICEDSRTYAAALRRTLEFDRTIEVIEVSSSAEQALFSLEKNRPDVITMDIELPGMSGLEAVEQIMGSAPCPILIVSSHLGESSEQAAAALAAGALDAVSKDELDVITPTSDTAVALRARIVQLSHVTVIRHPRSRLSFRNGVGSARTARYIGICSSTGGPQALAAVLSRLPSTFPIPIVVVQHIAKGFSDGLAKWLDTSIPLNVKVARIGDVATPGVWIAPEGAHLKIGHGGRFVADLESPPGLHQPSGDVLFAGLAELASDQVIAVVLSGMGKDGAIGAKAVRDAGGPVVAQDEESSAVYGMPKAAAELAGATILSLDAIGDFLGSFRLPSTS